MANSESEVIKRQTIHSLSAIESGSDGNVYENLQVETSGYGRIRNYYTTENIYENICEDCGRLYDDRCTFCFDEEEVTKRGQSIVKFINSIKASVKRKKSKKIRPEIGPPILISSSRKIVDFEVPVKPEVVYENLHFVPNCCNPASVNDWLKMLMKHTEDYEDYTPCVVKCIPSRTFNCCESNVYRVTPPTPSAPPRFLDVPHTPPITITWTIDEPDELEQKMIAPMISSTTTRRQRQQHDKKPQVQCQRQNSLNATHTIVTSYMLSISLNTFTLTYDNILERFLYHFDEACSVVPGVAVFQLFLQQHNNDVHHQQHQLPQISHHEDSLQPENIYQSLWTCRSTNIDDTVSLYGQSFDDNDDDDEQDWEIADEFCAAYDLKELFEVPTVFHVMDDTRERTYTKVEILFDQENPEVNRIIYTDAQSERKTPKKAPFRLNPVVKGKKKTDVGRKESIKYTGDIYCWLQRLRYAADDEEDMIIKKDPNRDVVPVEPPTQPETPSKTPTESDILLVLEPPTAAVPDTPLDLTFGTPLPSSSASSAPPPRREKYKKLKHDEYPHRRSSIGPMSPTLFDSIETNIKKSKSQGDLIHALKQEDKERQSSSGFTGWMKTFLGKFKSSKDLKTEESQKKVFGTQILSLDLENNVPVFVMKCIELLDQEQFITTSGIYRASGNKIVIDELKKKIDQGSSKNTRFKCLKEHDVNTLTGILKQFFRELPEPLVTEDAILKCMKCLGSQTLIDEFRCQIQEIPEPSRSTLKFLVSHLVRVSNHKCENKMNTMNLSIVWGPCVFKCMNTEETIMNGTIERVNQVLKTLIENYDDIFEGQKPEES